ncbi:hypothetical protein GCM10009819_24340 [Agromyces tropicus]|uniref:DUF4386 domain-containing protein n=1 Tax=Agromyces tropicus TaxID=555371 RepID=A0ABN2UJY9_9MICO
MDRTHDESTRGGPRLHVPSRSGRRRRATTIAGLLVIAGFATGILTVVPVLEEAGYLAALPDRRAEVVSGTMFQLPMAMAYAAFALVLHPILRRFDPTLALGFVSLRMVALGFHVLAMALLTLILDVGVVDGGAVDASDESRALVVETLRLGRDLVNHVVVIVATALGDSLLFVLLLRHRLVPAWLSTWGLAGAASAILASLLLLAGVVDVVGIPYLALTGMLGLQGLALAVWLIVRGLDTGAPRSAASA